MRRLPEFDHPGLRPAGLPGLPGRRGRGPRGAHRRSVRHRGRGDVRPRRPGGGHRAQPGGKRRARRRAGDPRAFDSIGAFEPPMPWLGFRRQGRSPWPPLSDDPGRGGRALLLPHGGRGAGPASPRRAGRSDGPTAPRWWPTCAACGARAPLRRHRARRARRVRPGRPDVAAHHRRSVEWLGDHVPGAVVYEIANAQHGAHLSHPDHFAAMTRLVVERAGPGQGWNDQADEKGAARRR